MLTLPMKIEGASAEQIRDVALRMRERDRVELAALNRADTREELADIYGVRWADRHDVLCALALGTPAAIGITAELRPNVLTLGFFATDDFSQIALGLTRFLRNRWFPRFIKAGVHRIEAVSIDGHLAAHRWLEILGMRQEARPLVGYGKRGEKFIPFAWTRDADLASRDPR